MKDQRARCLLLVHFAVSLLKCLWFPLMFHFFVVQSKEEAMETDVTTEAKKEEGSKEGEKKEEVKEKTEDAEKDKEEKKEEKAEEEKKVSDYLNVGT